MSKEVLDLFPKSTLTSIETVADTVLALVEGQQMTDANGLAVPKDQLHGQAAEISVDKFYFRPSLDYCDSAMKSNMLGASQDSMIGRI